MVHLATCPRVPCGYFVGCGFAVRHADYDRVGGFDERYVYSTEELDLAFALQHDDGLIIYEPRVSVVHAPSARGRAPRPTIPALRLRNRLLLVRRHLPWPVAVVHGFAWSVRTLQEAVAERGVAEWLRGCARGPPAASGAGGAPMVAAPPDPRAWWPGVVVKRGPAGTRHPRRGA